MEQLESRALLSVTALDLAVTPIPANVVNGQIGAADEIDTFTFSVSETLGGGSFTTSVVTTNGALIPRLTLAGANGELLIQSDSGRIVQFLLPGDYSIGVSAQAGSGDYRLTTAITEAGPPLSPLAAGALPRAVVVADFNNDGHADVVVPNLLGGTVSVMLGNGDATFQPQRVFDVGRRSISVAAADLNRDGNADILTPNRDDDAISVLLGNGDGTFQSRFELGVTGRSGGVVVADLNGDGQPDVAANINSLARVSVLIANADGTFQPERTFAVGTGPGKVEIADVNGDGVPDLMTPNYDDSTISLLLGRGDGTFEPQRVFDSGANPYSLKVADLNGDGRPDLAVTNYIDNAVSVLLGEAGGTFGSPQQFASGTGAYVVAVADVNGDGATDLATANFSDNSISVLRGFGDGTFTEPQQFAAGRGTGGITIADIDGDGRPDIVTADFTDNAVSVLLGRGDGTFAIRPAPAPAPDLRIYSVAVADLNGDGRPDVVTDNKNDSNVSVLLRNPDGSFQTRQTFPTGPNPSLAVIADINGDGVSDIVTSSYTEATASVLLGRTDGTFAAPLDFAVGNTTYFLAVADVNGDGRPDIATANNNSTVSVLINIDGTSFEPHQTYETGRGLVALTIKDADNDGLPDIVTANSTDGSTSVLLGNGDGTFQPKLDFAARTRPSDVFVGFVNGDALADIIITNTSDNSISVLLGLGGGAFQPQLVFPAGIDPAASVVSDFTNDGILDLITQNVRTGVGALLVGNGDGTFDPPRFFPVGTDGSGLAFADFNGDGELDFLQGNFQNDSITIVDGNGDGTFGPPDVIKVGENRYSVAVADVNGDGKTDVIQTNLRQNTLSIRLGTGTGSFDPGQTLDVGSRPTSVRIADFNADGRLDLVTTNSGDNSVSVALGNGDGSFNAAESFAVGASPRAVHVADVDGDGALDLAVSNYTDGTVSVLLGNGDGSFGNQSVFAVGNRPYSLSVADVDGDRSLDLVVANSANNTVSVLMGNGDGTFQNRTTFASGRQPFDATVADANGDQIPDVLTANFFDDSVSLLLGNGDGSFQPAAAMAVGRRPSSVIVVDLDGDRILDFVTANFGDDTSSVLLGNGDGTFQPPRTHDSHLLPTQTVAADINGDGRPDLVTVGNHNKSIGVLLSTGNGEFRPASAATDVTLRNTPLLADLNRDGFTDRIVLDRSGMILFRAGLSVAGNSFAPPVILNPDRPARDITILRTGSELAIAAADARFDSDPSTSQFVFTVSLYGINFDGTFGRHTAFSTTAPPSRVVAADLNGDGLADLIAANPLGNSITIALRTSIYQFGTPITVSSGNAPSDISVADVNADGWPDVLISNQGSGDVSVVLNDSAHSFSQSLRFRAGTQPYSLDENAERPLVSSLAESVSLVSGDFTGDRRNDVVVVNRGAHSVTVLAGNGCGGFANPQTSLTTSTSDGFQVNERPGAAVSGDFNRDRKLDLAVLMQDTGQLWIFSGDGRGTFEHTFTVPVGDQATGLTVAPGHRLGLLDLVVGNGFGDVLPLEGKGDGTFQIRGNRVSLSVVPDLFGPGQAGVLVGNQQDNRVTVQTQTSNGTGFTAVETLGADNESQLAPGDVQWSLLARGTTIPDAVVVSTGGNAVIVYHTLAITNGVPIFASEPQTFFVGTAPASVTFADIDGDGDADLLVPNQGSNDVSVIFGSFATDGSWTGTVGPRLHSGGAGPIAVSVRDLDGDDIPDLAATNGRSGTISMLPGVGQGFFDDRQPQTLLDLGGTVDQPPTFQSDSSVGFAVTTSGDLIRFDLSDPASGAPVVFSGSQLVAARALPSGEVIVATANGTVKVLSPQGNQFIVSAELQSQAGSPLSPSSLVVVQQASGQFQVLVSSRGSDTVSVFSASSATTQPPLFLIPTNLNNSTLSNSFTLGFVNFSNSLTSSSLSSPLSVAIGLSLSSFSSQSHYVFTATSSAVLVAVEGNSYSTVAVLDFGSQQDDESGDGRGRMPWLSTRFPVGDTSPLARFVIGLEDALGDFQREVKESRLTNERETPPKDPWNLDLFHRQRPSRLPARKTKADAKPTTAEPKADNAPAKPAVPGADAQSDEQALLDSFWKQCPGVDPPVLTPTSNLKSATLAVWLSEALLMPPTKRENRGSRRKRLSSHRAPSRTR